MTVLFALLASVFLGIGDFLGGTLSRKISMISVLVLSQLVAAIVLIPRIIAEPVGPDPGMAWVWGAVSGVAAAIGVSALYKALAIGTMGVVAPIAALSVLVPVVAGLIGGDSLSIWLVVGMIIAIIGTVLASGPELTRGAGAAKPIILALIAAFGFGSSNLAVAWGSATDISATLITNVLTTLAIYLVAALIVRQVPRARGKVLIGAIAIGVLGFGATLLFALAAESGVLSVVAVCASVFPAVTVLLGWWFHKEHLKAVQIVGVVAVLGGVALVALVS